MILYVVSCNIVVKYYFHQTQILYVESCNIVVKYYFERTQTLKYNSCYRVNLKYLCLVKIMFTRLKANFTNLTSTLI